MLRRIIVAAILHTDKLSYVWIKVVENQKAIHDFPTPVNAVLLYLPPFFIIISMSN